MNCQECLAVLETGSLRELTPDSPVFSHAATCPDCARVTTVLRDREYEAATFLNNLAPASHPAAVAESAIALARRRRVGKVVTMIAGTALAASIWLTMQFVFVPMMNRAEGGNEGRLRTETIPLACLSPQQAGDIINPYVRARGSVYYVPSSGLRAITVRGTHSEISKSRELISEFEKDPSAECRLGNRNPPAGTGLGSGSLIDAPVLAGDKAPPAPRKP